MADVSHINQVTPRRFIRRVVKVGSLILLAAGVLTLMIWIKTILGPSLPW